MSVDDPVGVMVEQLCSDTTCSDLLGVLFRSFCTSVPYDTTLKRAGLYTDRTGPLRGTDPDLVAAGFCASGTGATCVGLATTFAAVAQRCGFRANLHAAYVENDGETLPSHVVCVVDTPTGQVLCDPTFFHLTPVLLPSEHNQRVFHGPSWSPMCVTNIEGVLYCSVQPSLSRTNFTYILGEHMSLGETLRVYETVGRYPVHLGPYVKLVHGSSLVSVNATGVTVKGYGGIRTFTFPESSAERAAFTAALLGRSDMVTAALTSQFEQPELPAPGDSGS